jgi:hypothetical protein
MKRLIGIAAFVLLYSIPAHGQTMKSSPVASSASTNVNSGGSGSYGGSLSGSTGGRLPTYPAAHLGMKAVSGGDPSYAPSTFLTFEQAVAEGKAVNARPKSVAEVAAENNSAPKARAKFAFEQDEHGNVIPAPQQ